MRHGSPSIGAIVSLALTACTTAADGPPETVRERLAEGPTELAIEASDRAGSVTARRRTGGDRWVSGMVELSVRGGAVELRLEEGGAIAIERFAVELGPIAIPPSVLGHDAQLTGVQLDARSRVVAAATWASADAAQATAAVDLGLSWTLAVDGHASPLGEADLRAVPVELVLSGDGVEVRADARAAARGTMWSWAELVKLEDMDLRLAAAAGAR